MTDSRPGSPYADLSPIPAFLDSYAAAASEAPALSFPGLESTFAELAGFSISAARKLAAAGVRRGDRVAVLVREVDAATVALYLGTMRLGAIVVPINARNKALELTYVLTHSEPGILLLAPEFVGLMEQVDAPGSLRVVVLGADSAFESGEALISEGAIAAETALCRSDDPTLILYTSGTTAQPKGCVHTHSTLRAQGQMAAERLEVRADDRLWSPMTFFHVGGWQALMIAWARGACFSHVGFFEPGAALQQLASERCTLAFPAFEPMWLAILNHPSFSQTDLTSLRIVINVASPGRLRFMQSALPDAIQVSCIGMTEAGGSLCLGSPHDSNELRCTSGAPLPHVEIRLSDPATGAPVADGEAGEMFMRSPSQFIAYFRDPQRTADVVDHDGWIRTGDLLCRNEVGCFTFVARSKDMLKVGGENVAATEIEGFLVGHPQISLAAVVPAPDAKYGEVAAAFIELTPGANLTEEEVIRYCIGSIATFKVPRYVRILDRLPTTGSGKLQKLPLQSLITEELRERGITAAPRFATR